MVFEALESIAAAISPTSITIVGFVFVILWLFKQSAADVLDIYVDISNGDYQLLDSNVEIISNITVPEVTIAAVSFYYQYAIIDPATKLQSLLDSITYVILFSIFVNILVKEYLLNTTNNG